MTSYLRLISSLLTIVLLASCSNLFASLTGGAVTHRISERYTRDHRNHTITFIITTQNNLIEEFTIELGGITAKERAAQISFGANVRSLLLHQALDSINLPQKFEKEETTLAEVLRAALAEIMHNT